MTRYTPAELRAIQDMTDGEFEFDRIQRVLPQPTTQDMILDIWCWVGTLVNKLLSEWYNAVWVDINMSPWGSREWRIQADAASLPFPEGTFSVITSSSVFDINMYEWQPQAEMLAEIYRTLKSDWRYIRIEWGLPGKAIPLPEELWEEDIYHWSWIWKKK